MHGRSRTLPEDVRRQKICLFCNLTNLFIFARREKEEKAERLRRAGRRRGKVDEAAARAKDIFKDEWWTERKGIHAETR